MTKCGKGCMPECEYFTTGGCISPFNCPYKIETGYINSATSTTDSLTGLLIEFDEMGLLRQYRALDPEKYAIEGREKVRKEIERLKSENAELRATLSKMETVEKELRERLEKAVELPTIYEHISYPYVERMYSEIIYYVIYKENGRIMTEKFGKNKSKAEARLKELKEKNDD